MKWTYEVNQCILLKSQHYQGFVCVSIIWRLSKNRIVRTFLELLSVLKKRSWVRSPQNADSADCRLSTFVNFLWYLNFTKHEHKQAKQICNYCKLSALSMQNFCLIMVNGNQRNFKKMSKQFVRWEIKPT